MMEETVIITVLPETDLIKMGKAKVWAEFLMKNLGEESETLLVRFPLSVNDGFFDYPEIDDFHVYADNIMLDTDPLQMPGEHGDTIQWVHFEVEFPPGEIVELEVDYTLDGTGEYPFVAYYYLLETGAGWYDSIGKGDIIVKLPYAANNKNVFIDSHPGWGRTTDGAILDGNEVRWHFEDLEPTHADNISIAMVWPSAWNKVEIERQNVENDPNDGEAWGRLGKSYKEIGKLRSWFRDDPGGEELFRLSLEAYEKALELLPNDPLWHAGLGDLLYWKYDWYVTPKNEENRAGFLRGLKEFQIAYELDPDDPYILNYIDDRYVYEGMVDFDGEEFIFTWLDQTPTLPPTDEEVQPSITPTPVNGELNPTAPHLEVKKDHTLEPDQEPTSEGKDTEKNTGFPLCGSIILIPMLLAIPLAGSYYRKGE
jgi:tetratricopeptide (TPR) repeat protein